MTACSPLSVLNVLSPDWSEQRITDVGFGKHQRLQLDVYLPKRASIDAALRPVVVFFYGGAWTAGSKAEYRFVASRLTADGFVVVIPDYRLYPEVVFPEFVNDAAQAVNWTYQNIESHGGDPNNVFVMGHSAGAQIAALLSLEQGYLSNSGMESLPRGFIGLAGPYDFLPLVSEELKRIFPKSVRKQSQAVNVVGKKIPPSLLLHGYQDARVKPRNSASLHQKILNAGGQSELKIYDDRAHVGILLALMPGLGYLDPVAKDVRDFINRHLAKGI